MPGKSTDNSNAGAAPLHVEHDLPCAKCKYNLRTLAWDADCPECGAPVLKSAPPCGFDFSSQRSEARFRTGIGVLGAALLIQASGVIAGVAAQFFHLSVPKDLFLLGIYYWMYAEDVAELVAVIAVLFVAQPFARREDCFKPRLALTTFALALAGVLAMALAETLDRARPPSPALSSNLHLACNVLWMCSFAAYVLLALHALLRVDRARHRALFWLMCLPVAASILLACGGLRWMASRMVTFEAGYMGDRIGLPWTILRLTNWWDQRLITASGGVFLMISLVFLRCLREAPRSPR